MNGCRTPGEGKPTLTVAVYLGEQKYEPQCYGLSGGRGKERYSKQELP